MLHPWLRPRPFQLIPPQRLGLRRLLATVLLTVLLGGVSGLWGLAPAWASLNDDTFDGNIFALYAGNGSLVPPKTTLATAFRQQHISLILFYLDDSSDCKRFSSVYSQLQAGYGRAADFLPINADTIDPDATYPADDARHYYSGKVPQLVALQPSGEIILDKVGQVPYETVDDILRVTFNLLPRQESAALKRRQFNEVNSELTQR